MRLKIYRASLIVGSKFTVFALFYFVFEGNFPSTSPRGAYIWRGDLTEGVLRYRFGGLILVGLIHEGAYFRNFTVAFLYLHAFCENEKTKPITMRNETLMTAKIELFHLFFFHLL